jgi:hypothetical protein
MPPLLPQLDWKAIFESGLNYETWLAQEQKAERRDQIVEAFSLQQIPTLVQGALKALPRTVYVVAIAEAWCGDVIRHVPVLQRMIGLSPNMQVSYISREQHKEAFARFLTNGGEAIPKFVFLNNHFVECGNWGPMPEDCRKLIARGKACGDVGAARKKVAALYDADPEKLHVINELMALIETASAEAP